MRIQFSFDDGCIEDLKLAGLMHKYGYKGEDVVFYIPSDWTFVNQFNNREPLSFGHVVDMAADFTVGSHSITHPLLTRISLEDATIEIEESKSQLEYLLQDSITHFCYPRGYANDEIREIVRKNYKVARNTLVGNYLKSPDPIWQTPTVHAGGKRRKEYEGTTWLNEAVRLLEEAAQVKNSIYHVWGHSWELTVQDAWQDLEKLLKKLEAYR